MKRWYMIFVLAAITVMFSGCLAELITERNERTEESEDRDNDDSEREQAHKNKKEKDQEENNEKQSADAADDTQKEIQVLEIPSSKESADQETSGQESANQNSTGLPSASGSLQDSQTQETYPVNNLLPFYGIWCQGTKDADEAEKYADRLRELGFAAQVFVTTDWSNLNKERWYVVTAGVYTTESDAKANLSSVQAHYKDAYVKYSGSYQGQITVQEANDMEDGSHVVCISQMSNDGRITFRHCVFYTEEPTPLNEVLNIGYSPDLKIYVLDPNEEYGPEVDSVLVTKDVFRNMINRALEWNGYGFVCSVQVENGLITEISEFYLP